MEPNQTYWEENNVWCAPGRKRGLVDKWEQWMKSLEVEIDAYGKGVCRRKARFILKALIVVILADVSISSGQRKLVAVEYLLRQIEVVIGL